MFRISDRLCILEIHLFLCSLSPMPDELNALITKFAEEILGD
jgi:hypothetical protein